uniref:Uncharacterized protein n=1 Tax=Anguilla anguilla TaxID=7936 RepID=A0A0E9Q7A6_ANGAN
MCDQSLKRLMLEWYESCVQRYINHWGRAYPIFCSPTFQQPSGQEARACINPWCTVVGR